MDELSVRSQLSERVKQALSELGGTQEQLADTLGVSKRIISYWVNGQRTPGLDKLELLSELTERPLSWFFENETEMSAGSILARVQESHEALQDKIGADRLSFGSADRLFEFLGVRPGAVSPFTLVNDPEHRVRLALYSSLMDADMLYFHPLVNDLTLGVTPDGLRRFLEVTGHEPNMVAL